MKKKVLSALLAVALFAGLAVPAFASTESTQAGDPSKVTKIEFAASSYDIKQDADAKDFDGEVKVYETNKKLVLDHNQLSWSLEGGSTAFSISGSKVTAIEKSGTATLVVKDDESGKVVAKTKLNAVPNTKEKFATSFKYASTNNKIPFADFAGGATGPNNTKDFEFKVYPIPSGTSWGVNEDKVETMVIADVEAALSLTGKVSRVAGFSGDENAMVFKITATNLNTQTSLVVNKQIPVNTVVPNFTNQAEQNAKKVTAKTIFTPVQTKAAQTIAVLSNKTIEVGETFSLADTVKIGASDSNILKDVDYSERALDNSDVEDYAIVAENGKVTGVAVGTNYIVATLENGVAEALCKVTVVAKGDKPAESSDMKLSSTSASMVVGGTAYITVANAPEDGIEWSIDNDNATIVGSKSAVKIFAKKVGTATVTCKVNGVELGKIAVTVKAADTTTTPSNPGATNNPQTGDSIFAGLF